MLFGTAGSVTAIDLLSYGLLVWAAVRGSHAELMARRDLYAELYELQSRSYQ